MWLSILLIHVVVILLVLAFCWYLKVTAGVCVSSRHLVGKVVLVTGGTSGIGYETAADLAERGARVLIASNERHGDSVRDTIVARSGNTDVYFIYLDLASLDSVRSVANHISSTEKRLDILINNAGALFINNKKTEDGLLLGMQINYFGPFLLTMLLLPLLTKTAPSRIINVSSISYQHGIVDLKDINKGHTGFLSSYFTYSDAKLCVALITMEFSRRLEGSGVTANFLHPGSTKTNINTVGASTSAECTRADRLGHRRLRVRISLTATRAPRRAARGSPLHLQSLYASHMGILLYITKI